MKNYYLFALCLINLPIKPQSVIYWPLDPLKKKVLNETSEDFFLNNRPINISLGDTCQPALNLTYSKLRFMAYPFDWITANFNDLCHIIETDFAYFKPEYFTQKYDYLSNAVNPANTQYPNIRFPHIKWEHLFEDLNRRIKRFRKTISFCISSKKNINFVIHSIEFRDDSVRDKSKKLHDLLLQKFSGLNFKIIIMHHSISLDNMINDNYIFCYLKHNGWTQESYNEWRQKFIEIGLINNYAYQDQSADHPFHQNYVYE